MPSIRRFPKFDLALYISHESHYDLKGLPAALRNFSEASSRRFIFGVISHGSFFSRSFSFSTAEKIFEAVRSAGWNHSPFGYNPTHGGETALSLIWRDDPNQRSERSLFSKRTLFEGRDRRYLANGQVENPYYGAGKLQENQDVPWYRAVYKDHILALIKGTACGDVVFADSSWKCVFDEILKKHPTNKSNRRNAAEAGPSFLHASVYYGVYILGFPHPKANVDVGSPLISAHILYPCEEV